MEIIKGESSCFMSVDGVQIKFKVKEWLGPKMVAKNSDHNALNKHKNIEALIMLVLSIMW